MYVICTQPHKGAEKFTDPPLFPRLSLCDIVAWKQTNIIENTKTYETVRSALFAEKALGHLTAKRQKKKRRGRERQSGDEA